MNILKNEHVKLDETCLHTQGHFKATLSNVMDVLECLTPKLHETRHTAYIHHNNSFKDLITSLITPKHIKPYMKNIGDLVINVLGVP